MNPCVGAVPRASAGPRDRPADRQRPRGRFRCGSTAMRKVVGRIPLARDEARSLSRSAPYSTWTCVSRAGAARSFYRTGRPAGPWLGRLGRRTYASGGSLLSTRGREGGALRVFGVRRVRAVGELASPARLDEWATRLLGHLLVADVLGRLLAGRRALHKLLAEFLREVVVRGAADELLRLLPLTRGLFLFAEVVPKQRFLVGHVGRLGGDPDARAQGGLLRPPGLRLRRGLARCGLLGVARRGPSCPPSWRWACASWAREPPRVMRT